MLYHSIGGGGGGGHNQADSTSGSEATSKSVPVNLCYLTCGNQLSILLVNGHITGQSLLLHQIICYGVHNRPANNGV